MAEFHFIRPWCLLLIVPMLWVFYAFRKAQQTKHTLPIASHLAPHLNADGKDKHWFAPKHLLPGILTLLIVIIAGPTWLPEPDSHAKNQSPLYFVIDLSNSMSESDLAPSRLENSKLKLEQLLSYKTDGAVGAYVYAGSAHLLIPATEDRDVLALYLSSLSTHLVPRQGKNLAAVFEQLQQSHDSKDIPASIIVVTDGLDNSSIHALNQYTDLHQDQILVWKFGYQETLTPPRDVRFLQNTPDDSDIASIQRWIDSFSYFDPQDEDIQWQEAGFYLVFPTLVLSLLWFRRGWSIRWVPSILMGAVYLGAIMPADSYAADNTSPTCDSLMMRLLMTEDQQGQWFYRQGNYACAAKAFVEPQWKIQALMKNEQWEWALTMLNQQPDSVSKRFNTAMSFLHIQRFRSAEHWFNRVLELNPEHTQAQQNLKLLEEIFDLMADRAQGQGTAGEDMTADVISSLEEDMGIDEPEERSDFINSADLMAEEHLTKIWLEQVKSNPEVFLRNKFAIQLQKQTEVAQ